MSQINSRKDIGTKDEKNQSGLKSVQEKQCWRSLEELAHSSDFQELMRQEFPENAAVWSDAISRRKFLTLMGASLALAGLGGCSVKPAPSEELVPYVHPPEDIVPGRPLFYATTMTFAGAATGLLVESHEGRPTKVEGNPNHPASLGGTDIFQQASILTLYDPDRAKTVSFKGQMRTWEEFKAAVSQVMQKLREKRGEGFRILSETIVSPTLIKQLKDFVKELPQAKWHFFDPINRDSAFAGSQMAFGEYVSAIYDFSKADVVLSLDADFLQCNPGNLRNTADFMARRKVWSKKKDNPSTKMNRLYVVETSVSCTGAKADHRLALRPSEIEGFAKELYKILNNQLPIKDLASDTDQPPPHPSTLSINRTSEIDTKQLITNVKSNEIQHKKWLETIANDLRLHRGRCLILAGDSQPPSVHLLAHVLNDQLGNVGQTVAYIDPLDEGQGSRTDSLRELIADIDKGAVDFLLILGGNPVYSAPVDFKFAEKLQKVSLRIHHGLYLDETSYQCHWHLPETHYLEAWSDGRAFDGTASIVQPLIEPLYQGRSAHEVLALLAGKEQISNREIVQSFWRDFLRGQDKEQAFEPFWEKCLHDGVIPETAFKVKQIKLKDGWQSHLQLGDQDNSKKENIQKISATDEGMEIVFQPDPTLFDGYWANNGWLQELPKPITKITWGNAAIISSKTAKKLGIELGSYAHGGEHGGYYMPVLKMSLNGRELSAPAWIMPGHADDTVAIYLGHGRTQAGQIGGSKNNTVGVNAYLLRTSDRPWFAGGLRIEVLGRKEVVTCTQAHYLMENRDPVRATTIDKYQANPQVFSEMEKIIDEEAHRAVRDPKSLYNAFDYELPKHKWGMAIDLTACVGCHACVVACQAENNIPVVGKEQVSRGREMHWLRIDRYIKGTAENPTSFHFQPVPCMHCENAPCEYVCPVEATVHSSDGLNDMLYQRCVGTRFCSNNCPYKVRRFNFIFFSDYETQTRRMQYNPDVTVRSRGVMEKCSYCVQRIRHAEIDCQVEGRPLKDGEVLTACQAACPTGAIVFGDINDINGRVARMKATNLNYSLLAVLNTNPRTTYLAELRNFNPDIKA